MITHKTVFREIESGAFSVKKSDRFVPIVRRHFAAILTFALLSGWGMVEQVWGCPNCKDTLQANGFGSGYALSILLLLSMPFCILGGWVVAIVRLRNRCLRLNQ
jgi:hypothetical protein